MSSFEKNSDKKEAAGSGAGDDNGDVIVNQLKALTALGGKEVLVILDLANLETVKTKKGEFQLLNCDDHISLLGKNNKDPAKYRPDIVHQEIMAVLDSPLNKAGKCRLLVHSEKNVLMEINPKTRVPRTFKRFSGLMVQLLHRLKIRSSDGKDTLLKVVKNPISRHLPAGAHIFGFSQKGTLHSPGVFAENLPDDKPIVLILGAMASGSISSDDHPYITQMVSLSEYPLSGVTAINRLLGSIEDRWGII
jgi:rRNA small subunit pseudouridine methyltransferase Nep1